MKFLIDENVRSEVIQFLRDLGYDVLIVPSGSSDEEIAKLAKGEGRIILTHDVHFSNILEFPPDEFSGIIRIKIHPPAANLTINALRNLLRKLPPSQINKKLIILEDNGFRTRE